MFSDDDEAFEMATSNACVCATHAAVHRGMCRAVERRVSDESNGVVIRTVWDAQDSVVDSSEAVDIALRDGWR